MRKLFKKCKMNKVTFVLGFPFLVCGYVLILPIIALIRGGVTAYRLFSEAEVDIYSYVESALCCATCNTVIDKEPHECPDWFFEQQKEQEHRELVRKLQRERDRKLELKKLEENIGV